MLFANLLEYGGSVWLLTVTAPGAAVLPWDGSKVEAAAAAEWNRTAAKRWSELHRWAYQATEREVGWSPTFLARVWQLQSRGVLHLHLVAGFESAAEREAAWAYVRKLRSRASEFGFGYVDARDRDGRGGRSMVMEPARAAGYVSRYLGESGQLVEAIALNERPRRLVWISSKLTRSSGVTMRRLRRARHLWAYRNRLCARPSWFADLPEALRVGWLLDGDWSAAARAP